MSSTNKTARPPTIPGSSNLTSSQVTALTVYGELFIQKLLANEISDGVATLTNGTLSGLTAPTLPSDSTNKEYVDALVGGTWKYPVVVTTTADIVLTGLQTIDTIPLTANDRVLVKNQVNQVNNGIYLAKVGAWTRTTDLAAGSSASGVVLVVILGLSNGSRIYQCTTPIGTDIVGTDPLVFVNFGNGGLSPGGSNSMIQFNDAGSFGGVTDLTWNGSTVSLTSPLVSSGAITVTNTTQSTSASTGAIAVSGGIGVVKNIVCNGNISATQFISTSDATLKKDVYPIENAIRKLDMLDPVEYRFNNGDDTLHYGILAQDLQEQGLGSMVHTNTNGHLAVNYNDIVGILIAVVKELKDEIYQLKKYK